jgi:4-amino-4-deoxy-L-arabinose transferase-like glycosyltransferase
VVTVHDESQAIQPYTGNFRYKAWACLLAIWLVVFFAALFRPSLLDDADSTHANAARAMVQTGDWVTLKVDGIRYLEKPPLPYWLVAIDYKIFGFNAFATHLPQALAVLGLALLAWVWTARAFNQEAAFYASLGTLTSVGVFLFTRFFIPEVLLSLLCCVALYGFLTGLEDRKPWRIYVAYAALGLAMLTKGLIAPVFFCAAAIPFLLLTGEWRRWRELRLFTGLLIFVAIAAPWHVMAGLRNPGQGFPGPIPTVGNVHGFWWFYFINEHVLRFLGKRYPHDYNKLPDTLYWAMNLVWLFPWSVWFPAALRHSWARWQKFRRTPDANRSFRQKTELLLILFAAFVLIFFAVSTNQEYYTFPAYFPLVVFTAGVLTQLERESRAAGGRSAWLTSGHVVLVMTGTISAALLAFGLWEARGIPFVSDIGAMLAHRGVGDYTLSMSRFFDLTGRSFAALRLPATIAALSLLTLPWIAYLLRRSGRDVSATLAVALCSVAFLLAAHLAFIRFEPLLSSRALADAVNANATAGDQLMIYGDQANASSVIFYTGRRALLVNGNSSSMLWGSMYTDAPKIFLSDDDLVANWGRGPRKFLVVQPEQEDKVEKMLGSSAHIVAESSGKTLLSDR